MIKNLGIDIDGTLSRPDFILPYLQRDIDDTLEFDDFTEYDLSFTGLNQDELSKWFLSIENELYKNAHPVDNINKYIDNLSKDYNISLITARPKKWKSDTINWLSKWNINYDSLDILGSHNKVQACIDRNIDLFIEDNLENALLINKELDTPVLLINTPYNQAYIKSGIIRVDDWDDIMLYINKNGGLVK